ncbi:MAG: hypothetical protein SGJ10_14590 [Bacteroidota bacterium]|nr:hypothetical protein [Bacteroidota bacterium]
MKKLILYNIIGISLFSCGNKSTEQERTKQGKETQEIDAIKNRLIYKEITEQILSMVPAAAGPPTASNPIIYTNSPP